MDVSRKKLFSTATIKEFRGHKRQVHSVGWNLDGKRLASGSVDHTARVFAVERTKDVSIELKGHTGDVDQLCWDPNHADILATASVDKTVRLWDVRIPRDPVHIIQTFGENINIAWHPNGAFMAVGSKEDKVSLIDLKSTPFISKQLSHDVEINEIGWDYSGELFFLTTGQGTVKILNAHTMEQLHEITAHTANCYCLEFDPKGRYFAVGGADALVSLWDLEECCCIRTFGKLDWPIRTVSFSHDGEFIASGSEDHSIDISHVESGEHVYSIPCQAASNTVAWHPSKYLLAFAGDEVDRSGRPLGNLKVFGFAS